MVSLGNALEPISAIEAVKTPIGRSNAPDKLFWPFTIDGEFNVKSGYNWIVESNSSHLPNTSTSYVHFEESWATIWKASALERIKQFVWRIKHNALATRTNMVKKRIAISL